MRKLVMLGLFAAIALSACASAIPGQDDVDRADDVTIVVYKSPT
jgi:hypothetical protein